MKNEQRGDTILTVITITCLVASDITDSHWLALVALLFAAIFCIKSYLWLKVTMNEFDANQQRLQKILNELKRENQDD